MHPVIIIVSLTYSEILSEYIKNLYKENIDSLYINPMIKNTINKIGNSDMIAVADYIIDIYVENYELIEDLDKVLWDTLEKYERKVSPKTIVENLYKRYGEKIFEKFEYYYDKEINSKYQLDAILKETDYYYVINVLYDYLIEEDNIIDEALEEILFKELEKY